MRISGGQFEPPTDHSGEQKEKKVDRTADKAKRFIPLWLIWKLNLPQDLSGVISVSGYPLPEDDITPPITDDEEDHGVFPTSEQSDSDGDDVKRKPRVVITAESIAADPIQTNTIVEQPPITDDQTNQNKGEAMASSDDTEIKGEIRSWYYSVPETGKIIYTGSSALNIYLWELYKSTNKSVWTVYEYDPEGNIYMYTYTIHGSIARGFQGISRTLYDTIYAEDPAPEQDDDSGSDDYSITDDDDGSLQNGGFGVDSEPEVEYWGNPGADEEVVEEGVFTATTTTPDGEQYQTHFETEEALLNYLHEQEDNGADVDYGEYWESSVWSEDDDGNSSLAEGWDDIPEADDNFWSESGLG